jgi:phage FluMu protein Com
MDDDSYQEIRCPRCGRYKGSGQFSVLELKCEKCKLRFQVTSEEGKIMFKALEGMQPLGG